MRKTRSLFLGLIIFFVSLFGFRIYFKGVNPSNFFNFNFNYDYLVIDANGLRVMVTLKGYSIYSRDGRLVFDMKEAVEYPPVEYCPTMDKALSRGRVYKVKAAKVEEYKIYLDEDYQTLRRLLVDWGLGKEGKVVIVSDSFLKRR